jgi:hypothetical protein
VLTGYYIFACSDTPLIWIKARHDRQDQRQPDRARREKGMYAARKGNAQCRT